MKGVTGKDMVDMMAEGIESFVKAHLLETIVKDLVDDFEDNITRIVSGKLAEMAFRAKSEHNHDEYRKDLHVLIEWSKGQKAYKEKYTIQSEIIE